MVLGRPHQALCPDWCNGFSGMQRVLRVHRLVQNSLQAVTSGLPMKKTVKNLTTKTVPREHLLREKAVPSRQKEDEAP